MKIGLAFPAFYQNFVEAFPEDNIITYDIFEEVPVEFMVFSGGADINPYIYCKENLMSSYSPSRDTIELDAYRYCRMNNISMLGICRGLQLLNAVCGGTLVQDLGIYGTGNHPSDHLIFYEQNIEGFTDLRVVNSLHHQGVEKLAPGFITIAQYMEVPEIIVNYEKKILCTQFHPEMGGSWGNTFLKEAKAWMLKMR